MYVPNTERYAAMAYRRCGKSGLKLPEVSLGLWHNFGDTNTLEHMEAICKAAFDGGITHFDLANNYGPPAGAAEQNFGKILKTLFAGYRDELIISTKAGFDMWEGPYGNWGSRKYLLASLDQSLKRMGLEYVDIFYHHRPDPETPLEETMGALAQAVQSGKALYVGLSNYDGATMQQACAILKELHCPFVINQNCYSMLNRTIEQNGLLDACAEEQKGLIVFSPLAQGLLTDRYLHGIPADSRMRTDGRFLNEKLATPAKIAGSCTGKRRKARTTCNALDFAAACCDQRFNRCIKTRAGTGCLRNGTASTAHRCRHSGNRTDSESKLIVNRSKDA